MTTALQIELTPIQTAHVRRLERESWVVMTFRFGQVWLQREDHELIVDESGVEIQLH